MTAFLATRVRLAPLLVAVFFGVVTAASSASAAPGDHEAFAAAQKLFDAKNYAAALPQFEALLATGSPNARLYVARSLRELGRLPEAYDRMVETVRDAGQKAKSEPKYAQTRDAAAAELALLEARIAHLVVAVADPPAGATVTLDTVELPPAKLGPALTVTPGAHVVELKAPGAATVRRDVSLRGGESRTLALTAHAVEAAPVPAGPAHVDAPQKTGGTLRTVGFITTGVGLASLATFAITGALAASKHSDLESQCGGVRCTDPSTADAIDSGKALQTVANVTLVSGLVLVAAGVPLVVFGGPKAQATVSARPGGLSLRGAF